MAKKRKEDSDVNTEVEDLSVPESSEPELEVAALPEVPDAVAPQPPKQQRVPLRAFLALAGKKWDQYAGFAHYAQKQKLKPRSVQEWRDEFEKFQKKPS